MNFNDKKRPTPLYDLTQIQQISRGDRMFEKRIIELFIVLINKHIHQLDTARINGEIESIKNIVHKLKSSVSQMGIVSLMEDFLNIELIDTSKPLTVESNNACDNIILILKSVLEELESKIINEKFE